MNTGYMNPTSEQLLVCAHSPHADLLVDDVHPPQTEQKHMQRSHVRRVGLISHNCIYRQQSIADLYRFKSTVAYLVRHCTSWCFLITAEVYFESAPHTNS